MAKRRSPGAVMAATEIDELTVGAGIAFGELMAHTGCTESLFATVLYKATLAFSEAQEKRRKTVEDEGEVLRPHELVLSHQMLTEWRTNPDYRTEEGPCDLPKRGRLSLTSLARKISPYLELEPALSYLQSAGAVVQRVTGEFGMESRWVRAPGASRARQTLALLSIHDELSALQRNLRPKALGPAALQRRAEHVFLPVRVVPATMEVIERRAEPFLIWVATYLKRCAEEAKPGEKMTWFGMQLTEIARESPTLRNARNRARSSRRPGR